MPSTIQQRDKEKLPEWAIPTANAVAAFGFKWVFDWEYPVLDPEHTQRVQIRDEAHVGQASEVIRYAELMKSGVRFPAGVVTRDGRYVDFNTRARAAHRLGWPNYGVFVIQDDYDGADAYTLQRLHILGASLNRKGPKDLTKQELAANVRLAAQNPAQWDIGDLARHLSVTRSFVQDIFTEVRAEHRAEKLGVPIKPHVNVSTRRLFGKRSDKLADEPFKQLISLVQDLPPMQMTDTTALVDEVIDITSGDDARLAFIAGERSKREHAPSPLSALTREARTSVAFFVENVENVRSMVDSNPATCMAFPDEIDKAIEVLKTLASEQRRVNAECEEAPQA